MLVKPFPAQSDRHTLILCHVVGAANAALALGALWIVVNNFAVNIDGVKLCLQKRHFRHLLAIQSSHSLLGS